MKFIFSLILVMLMINLIADFRFGKELFEDGLYEEAILEFEKTIAVSPTSEDAQQSLFYIGECFFKRGKFQQAEDNYLSLLDGYPNNSFKDKILFKLALSQFKQKKFITSSENFNILINKYPLSQFTEQSLPYFVQSYFEQKDFNMVIIKGQKLINDYEKSSQVPEILLWMAKAYFAKNMPAEGENTLRKITVEYPDSYTRWKALQLEIDLLAEKEGTQKAAAELSAKLEADVPRQFEEELRLKLIDYYFLLEQYDLAYRKLSEMMQKFDNSSQLDFYIILKTESQLKLKKFEEILAEVKDFKKVFKESELKENYELNIARAEYYLKNYGDATNKINEILTISKNDSVVYESKFLQAKIMEDNGKFNSAVVSYKEFLNSKYAKKDFLIFNIGNIYFEKFENYRTAIKFYQQIVTQFSKSKYQIPSIYRTALCYEKLENYEEAINELSQIDLEEVENEEMIEKISLKSEYLLKFKQKDYENAFYKLMNSIYIYLEDDNKENLKKDIISILADDLKELEKSEEMIDEKKSPVYAYLKANIYLKVARRSILEGKNSEAENSIKKADELISSLNSQTQKQWITELNLEKDLILNIEISTEIISRLEKFTDDFPDSKRKNKFLLEIIKFYSKQENNEKMYQFMEKLALDETINESDFYRSKLDLAEYYYQKNDFQNALRNFILAESQISIEKPLIYFHYAVSLNESGEKDKSVSKLEFLVNNAEDFDEFENAIKYLVGIFKEKGKFDEAIEYSLLIPEKSRNDEFYADLSENYLNLVNKEKAKESLMYIKEKDNETLRKLALLQFETKDYEMAKYTYGQLIEAEKDNLWNYEMLAHISFLQEDFLEAAENYKIIVEKLGDNFQNYENIQQVALENIISLYRIENRPKAETLTKKFKDILFAENMDEIELNKGIYQIEVNLKKAEKIFNNLLKKQELEAETKIAVYFWRGVARLKQEKIEEAESDFKTVANSIDVEMSKQAHLKLGTINFSKENFQQALEHYYKVIELDESGQLAFDAAKNFAFVCKTIEEWQKAISAYEIILERWGDAGLEAQTVFDIAFCHFRDKKYAKAIEMFERAIPILTEKELQAEAQYWIGESYFGLEDYEKAISEFLKVGYNYSEYAQWTASAELRAGESYINSGKKDKAKRTFERIIEKYGKFSNWGKEASKRLESL